MNANNEQKTNNMNVRSIILAGGKGMRLRPLTAVFPKPLVPLGNKSIIEILLAQLRQNGLQDVTICTGYLAGLIRAVCGDGSKYGLNIEYINEDKPLGTAAPLQYVENLSDPVIVMNGDLLTTMSYKNMIEYHISENADITIGAYQRDVKIDFGVIKSGEDGAFQGFTEKPTYHYEVSMGVNVVSKRAIEMISSGSYLDMPDFILHVHKMGGKIALYREDCYWLDIGRLDDYALAQDEFEKNESSFLK
jgi:NDP-sugar pyrophosphorylase family protein